MTRTEAARLVGHNYRHLGVTFGKPWERIDGPGEYVGRHRAPETPECPRCKGSGVLWDVTLNGSMSRPCPCGCNPLVLVNGRAVVNGRAPR